MPVPIRSYAVILSKANETPSSMQPRQQYHTHREHAHRNPELHIRQNRFQHLDKPNGIIPMLSKIKSRTIWNRYQSPKISKFR